MVKIAIGYSNLKETPKGIFFYKHFFKERVINSTQLILLIVNNMVTWN